jgi:hypothetical protein
MLFPRSELPIGVHKISIEVTARDHQGQEHRVQPVRFPVRVCPDLQISPGTLPLGIVEVGKPVVCSLEVKSRTGKPFHVTNDLSFDKLISAKVLGTEVTKAAVQHGLRIELKAMKVGAHSSKLLIKTQYLTTPPAPNLELPLYVSYVGEEQKYDQRIGK